MKHIATVAGILLGLIYLVFGLNFFFQFIAIPQPAEGSPFANFMGAMYGTGFLKFVKILEILGGVVVMIPALRNVGLLILGPIIVNIVCAHFYLLNGANLFSPPVLGSCVLGAFLLFVERKAWLGLLNRR
jgi:putative oxidoreductase